MHLNLALTLGFMLSMTLSSSAFASVSSEEIENAVIAGDVVALAPIINSRNETNLFNMDGIKNESLLLLAAKSRQAEVVKLVLKRVKNNSTYLEVTDANGKTALYYAAFYGREDIALSLLQKGAKSTSIEKSLLIELMNNVDIRDFILSRGDEVAAIQPSFSIPRIKVTLEKVKISR